MTASKEKPSKPLRRHTGYFIGVLLVGIGIIFLLQNTGYLPGDVWGKIWPLIVITVGLAFVIDRHS